MVVIEGESNIALFQMVARRGALSLELKGMKRRGRSAYVICKEAYGLRGSRAAVLAQMDQMIAWRKSGNSHS